MPAITTAFLAPTNSRGSRIVTKSHCKRIVVGWNHALGATQNHTAAAMHHAKVMGWAGEWVGSSLGAQGGMVFVRPNADSECFTVPSVD